MSESDWTKWEGGECPVRPEELVAVRWRSGNEWSGHGPAFQWHHNKAEPQAFEIVAYINLSNPFPSDPKLR